MHSKPSACIWNGQQSARVCVCRASAPCIHDSTRSSPHPPVPCRYLVTYNRTTAAEAALSLAGRLEIQSEAHEDVEIALPNITVTLRTGQFYSVPKNLVRCPSLTVPASSVLRCEFSILKHGIRPIAGSVQASVVVKPAKGRPGETLKAAPMPFDFINAKRVAKGEFAIVSDFFERGDGLVQPASVYGEQPAQELRLGDSASFKFTGWFGGAGMQCGKELWVS